MDITPPLRLATDGREYEVLYEAVVSTRHVPGLSCEVGTRRGGSSELIMRATVEDRPQILDPHVCVDPYGSIPYPDRDTHVMSGTDYTRQMRLEAQQDLSLLGTELSYEVLFLPMEDTEYFARFSDGVPVYDAGLKRLCNRYRLVFLDGPHTATHVRAEVEFFAPRMSIGGAIVVDNIDYYDHDQIHGLILDLGFSILRMGAEKAAYIRIA